MIDRRARVVLIAAAIALLTDVEAAPAVSALEGKAAPSVPASPEEGADVPRVTPLPPMRELIPPVNYNLLSDAGEPSGPAPDEAGIPRWLRPSVREARGTGPVYRPRGG